MLICLRVIQFQAQLCSCNREWPRKPKIICCPVLYRKSLLTLAQGCQSQRLKTGKSLVDRSRIDDYEALSYLTLFSFSSEALKVLIFGSIS